MVHMDNLSDEGFKKYVCPKCRLEVIDDFELMVAHMDECNVNCKTCVDFAASMLDKTQRCYRCGGHNMWRERK
jgi:hypothetical protein